jgi:hypothetical protein
MTSILATLPFLFIFDEPVCSQQVQVTSFEYMLDPKVVLVHNREVFKDGFEQYAL